MPLFPGFHARCEMKTFLIPLLTLMLFAALPTLPAHATMADSWRFQVLLDDQPIGQHNFNLRQQNDMTEVKTQARLSVKILGFTVYRYQHDNTENWQGACLTRMQASTNDNGEQLVVNGSRSPSGFRIQTAKTDAQLPPCLQSFAYWNLAYLKQATRLLNSQTGALVEVRLQAMGDETIMASGQSTPAKRYRLSGQDLQIDLWYSAKNRWLGLESLADGKRIRYVLQ